ncbi:radical SAM protein [Anaerosporomusa subterranea]|uniref:Radical SAM protein n=1 Tax=Anaerosporomusa subterranea TaxID=1794912 RepID=A0A154BM56_ANASB|nr:radical SAM protein [Anaerosporomusa subterranea]KYZ74981.1 radical SAM protein [Anaerosporomusa subterranea]
MYRELLASCQLCPRQCGVNRLVGQVGFCQAGNLPRLGLVSLHHWEEPCLSGTRGSGTVFFSHCNLRCLFCQNHAISQGTAGKEVSVERLADIFLEQQQRGAHNINLVTPGHYAAQIAEALTLAKRMGLVLPIIYNTNAYDSKAVIEQLRGLVDIYLPDLKYIDERYSTAYSQAPDYFRYASAAISAMVQQIGEPIFDSDGIMTRGVIIRHLALPGMAEDSRAVIRYVYETFGHSVYLSLMNQYTPLHQAVNHPTLCHCLSAEEYADLVDYALALGVENGFIQEGGAVSESFVPLFDCRGA